MLQLYCQAEIPAVGKYLAHELSKRLNYSHRMVKFVRCPETTPQASKIPPTSQQNNPCYNVETEQQGDNRRPLHVEAFLDTCCFVECYMG